MTATSIRTKYLSWDTETPQGTTRTLLVGGIIAGPLFLIVSTIQALTRDGFDITKVALSSLSLGDYGWIQIANFVVTGLLCLGAGIGLRRVHPRGRARLAPPLFMIFGLGQIAAGVFTQDPAMGFPPGTPDGMPDTFTWHGILHIFSALLAFLSAAAGIAVTSRRFAGTGGPRWRTYSITTAVVGPALAIPPHQTSAGIRLAVASGLVYLWLALYAIRLLREPHLEMSEVGHGS